MKKLFVITLTIAILVTSLSAAYYFVVFLPQQEKVKTEAELKKVKSELENTKEKNAAPENTNFFPPKDNVDDKLDQIQSTLDQQSQQLEQQERENRAKMDCSNNGGTYAGGTTCVFY